FPVVGISWFEAEAYTFWLTERLRHAGSSQLAPEVLQGLRNGQLMIRLPTEVEWEAAMGGRGEYPWGQRFAATRLNCEESWKEGISNPEESRQEASTTAVTTYPQGVSQAGMWDGSGNVWEWTNTPYTSGEPDMVLRDTSGEPDMVLRGGAWYD